MLNTVSAPPAAPLVHLWTREEYLQMAEMGLFGATIHLIPAGPDPKIAVAPDEDARVKEIVDGMRRHGERPYVIPIGGSSGIGALGYASGTLERALEVDGPEAGRPVVDGLYR